MDINLTYEPKKKGLTWNRTYLSDFFATYQVTNPTDAEQTFYISFQLPSEYSSYHNFTFKLGDNDTRDILPQNGAIKQAVCLAAGESIPLNVGYLSRGMNQWLYQFNEVDRIHDFQLNMQTNFSEVDFPEGSSSPTDPLTQDDSKTWNMRWQYPDVIHPQNISGSS